MSKALTKASDLVARIKTIPVVADNEIRVAQVHTERYDQLVERHLGAGLDGVVVLVMFVGAENADARITDAAHSTCSFQVEIWKDPNKHREDVDPTFDEIDEAIISHIHGWTDPATPSSLSALMRWRWNSSEFLGDVINKKGVVEFLRWALTFQSRTVVSLQP